MRHINHEAMEAVTERVERLRDYVPAEEFDLTTALFIAKNEAGQFCHNESWPHLENGN